MAEIFKLEAVFAGKGDALILHYGTSNRPRWTLIDGGHRHVYANYLRPRFDQLRIKHPGSLTSEGKLPLDLVMVSHADEDHLLGLLDLKAHLEEPEQPLGAAPVDIRQMWLNGFADLALAGTESQDIEDQVVSSALGNPSSGRLSDAALRDPDTSAVVASTRQGRELRDFARSAQIDLNKRFDDGLIRRDAPGFDARRFRAIPGVEVTVLGPDEERINRLRQRWQADVAKLRKDEKSKATAFDDASVHNLASIMVLLERGHKTMLLTDDGRGDHVVEGLIAQGFLDSAEDTLRVDLFKIPHHGSSRNVTTEMFRTIHADHYLISANGEHDNPDPEMLTMLAHGRQQAGLDDTEYRVYFTFPDRAFELITNEAANKSAKRRKQRDALIAINDWIRDHKPEEFIPVFRERDKLSLTVDLL